MVACPLEVVHPQVSALAEEEDRSMARRKKHGPEEIVAKLRQVEVPAGQGSPRRPAAAGG